MFSYRLLHFPKKKKNVAFLIGFFKPIFLFNFLAFPFIKFVLRLFFLFFILSFDLVSSLPFLPQLLAFLSLYLSKNCCYLYVATVNVTYRSPFACHFACVLLPACLIARSHCIAYLYMRLRSN